VQGPFAGMPPVWIAVELASQNNWKHWFRAVCHTLYTKPMMTAVLIAAYFTVACVNTESNLEWHLGNTNALIGS
jgi:hypothetical protein